MTWLTNIGNQFYETMIVDDRYLQILWGLGNTLIITVCAILLGIVIGTLVAMVKAQGVRSQEPGGEGDFQGAGCHLQPVPDGYPRYAYDFAADDYVLHHSHQHQQRRCGGLHRLRH